MICACMAQETSTLISLCSYLKAESYFLQGGGLAGNQLLRTVQISTSVFLKVGSVRKPIWTEFLALNCEPKLLPLEFLWLLLQSTQ